MSFFLPFLSHFPHPTIHRLHIQPISSVSSSLFTPLFLLHPPPSIFFSTLLHCFPVFCSVWCECHNEVWSAEADSQKDSAALP